MGKVTLSAGKLPARNGDLEGGATYSNADTPPPELAYAATAGRRVRLTIAGRSVIFVPDPAEDVPCTALWRDLRNFLRSEGVIW